MKKILKKSLLIVSIYSSLNALECKKQVFAPAINAINQTTNLLGESSVSPKILNELKTVKITKKNYSVDIKILKKRLFMLEQKKKYAIEAKKINNTNIQTWISLEKACKGDDKLAAKKIKNDVIDLKDIIKTRISTIEHYFNLTKTGIEIGKQKYGSKNK